MVDKYYVIWQSGCEQEIRVWEYTRDELMDALHGRGKRFEIEPELVFDALPTEDDPIYWPFKGERGAYLIIKGKVIKPKAVTTVTNWKIE